jgi:hypothetical protein
MQTHSHPSVCMLPGDSNSIGVSVPKPYRLDAYVCSKSLLTVFNCSVLSFGGEINFHRE